MSRFLLACVVLAAVQSWIGGCSAALALAGNKSPDLTVVHVGASRADVEVQIGTSVLHEEQPDGRCVRVYRCTTENEPSGRRAALHVVANVFTMGLWEVHGAMMEMTQGVRHQFTVTYSPDHLVIAIWHQMPTVWTRATITDEARSAQTPDQSAAVVTASVP